MLALPSKDGDFSSYFDEIDEDNFSNIILKELLIDNHTTQANKRKTFGQLSLEPSFGSCNTL